MVEEEEEALFEAALLRKIQENEDVQRGGMRKSTRTVLTMASTPPRPQAARTTKLAMMMPTTTTTRDLKDSTSNDDKENARVQEMRAQWEETVKHEKAALRNRLVKAETELASLRSSRDQVVATSSREHEHAAAEIEALREQLLRARAGENEAKRQTLILVEENKKLKVEVDVLSEKLDVCAEKLSTSERRHHDATEAVGESNLIIADLEQQLREVSLESKLLLKQKNELVQRNRSHDASMSDAVYTMEDKLAAITVSSQQQQQQALRQMDEYKRGLLIAERNKLTLVDKVVDALDGISRCLDGAIGSRSSGADGSGSKQRMAMDSNTKARRVAAGKSASEMRSSGTIGSKSRTHSRVRSVEDGGESAGANTTAHCVGGGSSSSSSGSKVFFSSNIPAVLLSKLNAVVDKVNALSSVYAASSNDVYALRNELQLIKRQRKEEAHEHEVRTKMQSAEHAKATASLRAADEAVKEKKQSIVGLKNDVDVFRRHATVASENNLVYQHCVATACDSLQRTLSASTNIEYFPKRPLNTPMAHVVGSSVSASDATAGGQPSSQVGDLVAGNAFDVDNLCTCLSDFVRLVDVSMKDSFKARKTQDELLATHEQHLHASRRELTDRAAEIAKLKGEIEVLSSTVADREKKLGEERDTHSATLAIIKTEVDGERDEFMKKQSAFEEEREELVRRNEGDVANLLNGFMFLARHLVATTTTAVANANNMYTRRIDRLLDAKELLTSLLLEESGRCHTLAELLSRSLVQSGTIGKDETASSASYTTPSRFRIAICAVLAAKKMMRLLSERTKHNDATGVVTVQVMSGRKNAAGSSQDPVPFSVVCPAVMSAAVDADLGEKIFAISERARAWMTSHHDIDAFKSAASGAVELFDILSTGLSPSASTRIGSNRANPRTVSATHRGIREIDGRSRAISGGRRGQYSNSLLAGSLHYSTRRSTTSLETRTRFDTFVDAARRSLSEIDSLLSSAVSTAHQHRRDLNQERHTIVTLSAELDRLREQLTRTEADGRRMMKELSDSIPVTKALELETVITKLRKTVKDKESQLQALQESMDELQKSSDGVRAANEAFKQQIVGYQQQQIFFKSEAETELQRSTRLQQLLDEAKAKVTSLEGSYNEVETSLRESRAIQRQAEESRAAAVEEMSHVKRQMDKQASIGMAQVSAIQEAVQIAKRAEEEVTKSRRQQLMQQETIERMRTENSKQKQRSILLREELYSSRHALDDIQSQLRLTNVADSSGNTLGHRAGMGVSHAPPAALPPSPSVPRNSYIDMARAELAAIRGAAKSKLGLIDDGGP